jgi:hypothetical protein
MSYVSDSGYGVQSTVGINSTITPLAGAATFTGTAELNQFQNAMISCFADVAGTLYADISVNGTDWRNIGSYPVSASSYQNHIVVKGPHYFRVRFINGSGAQATFQLYTFFGVFAQQPTPLNQVLSQTSDSILVRSVDPILDISAGKISGFVPVSQIGRAPDGVQTTATDIWDRGDATPTQQIWVAPTTARVHAIVSDSASDASAGVGARTIRVTGLTSWTSKETTEDVTMSGVTPVNTVNSYVIIYKLSVLTKGGTSSNVGTIKATAATDATITAVIRPLIGSSEMAIFGWPSTQNLCITNWKSSINKSSAAASHATYQLLYNSEPNAQLTNFIEIDLAGRHSTGSSSGKENFLPYLKLAGPGILKIQATASANDLDSSAGFSGILVDV